MSCQGRSRDSGSGIGVLPAPLAAGSLDPPLSTLGPPVSLQLARTMSPLIMTGPTMRWPYKRLRRTLRNHPQRLASALQLRSCPVIEVPFLRMLSNKSQPTVTQALAAMLSQIQYEGSMVRRVHSDRGCEFNNTGVHRLCGQRNLYETFTRGMTPNKTAALKPFMPALGK